MMTDEELQAAKALCDAATPGPWVAWESYNNAGVPLSDFYIPDHNSGATVEMKAADAAFIVASRTLVPKLIAEVERLRADNTVQRVVNMRAQSRISYLASLAGEGDE